MTPGHAVALALCALAGPALGAADQEASPPLQGGVPPAAPALARQEALPRIEAGRPQQKPKPGGPTVVLREVLIEGNDQIDTATVLAALGEIAQQRFDLAGLWGLAERVEDVYHRSGYPFAQAWVMPQDLSGGRLRLRVLEGRYGKTTAANKGEVPAGAQGFLDHMLRHGDPIEARRLERAMLILDDQPGMRVQPQLFPGAEQGEGDLVVDVTRSSWVSGEAGVDNIGSRPTGQNRARGTVNINSPTTFGDRFSISGMYTSEHMWLGSAEYERPLGTGGLRGSVGYAHTSYVLGGDYASLNARGLANIATARLNYPLIRSQANNLWLSGAYQAKSLQDRYDTLGIVRDKTSHSVPLSLQFDRRDALFGGGVSYGSLTWTAGRLSLDGASTTTDAQTARTEGFWNKLAMDVARIQNLPGAWRVYARVSGQWANKNLDASEKLGVAGFYGVRAYPMGEAMADAGYVAQVELRYVMGAFTPFAFYDRARARLVNQPWDTSAPVRSLSGAGLGLRYLDTQWSVDAIVAWRGQGGASVSEPDRVPRVSMMATRRF